MRPAARALLTLSVVACSGSASAYAQEPPPADPANLVVQPSGLTATKVQERAVAASATLSAKRAQLDAANARIEQTRLSFYPQLGVRASYTRLSPVQTSLGDGALVGAANPGIVSVGPCPGNANASCALDAQGLPLSAAPSTISIPENNYALGASLTVPLSDYAFRVSDAADGAAASRDAALHALQAEQRSVRAEARVLYFNWLRTHGQVRIAEQAVEQAQARRQEAQAAFDLGTLSRADLLKLEALVAEANLAVQRAQTGRALAAGQLAIVMNDPSGTDYTVGEEVPTLDAADADLESDPKRLDAALSRRLELLSLDDAAASLAHGEAAANVGRAPRLDAVAQVDLGNPNSRYFPPEERWNATWSVGLVASWNVTEALVTAARSDELAAQRAAVLAQRQAVARAIAAEVSATQAAVRDARAAQVAGATSLLAAQEGYRVAAESFRLGQLTASDLVDAETDLLHARLALFNARIDLATATIRLHHALGHDAP